MNLVQKTPQTNTKVCPRCGQKLFADMDICYGCLFDFRRLTQKNLLDDKLQDSLNPDPATILTTAVTSDLSEPNRQQPSSVGNEAFVLQVDSSVLKVGIPLPVNGLLLGREEGCDVVLHERAVSRQHVRLVPDHDGVGVYDCGSTNRAKLNGRSVTSCSRMRVGDTLNVCGTLFVLKRVEDP